MKKVTIEISGGYHDVDAFRVRVSANDRVLDTLSVDDLECAVSPATWARIKRRCCGIASCSCGGVSRCDIEVAE